MESMIFRRNSNCRIALDVLGDTDISESAIKNLFWGNVTWVMGTNPKNFSELERCKNLANLVVKYKKNYEDTVFKFLNEIISFDTKK